MAGTRGLTPEPESIARRVGAVVPDVPIAVALSGGADSAVCAWAVLEAGRQVRAITVDHGLSGSAALVDAAAAIAAKLGIAHTVVTVRPGGNEGELRELRYAALERAAEAGEVLVTGHTADDQAETVLGNLMRGAGAAGLAGIPAHRGRWRRPLLEITREEARAAARSLGLPFVDDPDNLSIDLRRSRLRIEAIPYLQERFNPALRDSLRRSGRLALEDDLVLEERAGAVPVATGMGGLRVAAATLATLPTAVAARVARRMLRHAFDPYAGDSDDVEAVLTVARGAAVRTSLSRGWLVEREGAAVVVHPDAPLEVPGATDLSVPGRVRFGGWTITAEAALSRPCPMPLGRWSTVVAGGPHPITVRAIEEGESIAMRGGSKRVVDALREAGVPARMRPAWPALERDGTMLWLVGARLAPEAGPKGDGPVVVLRAEVPT